MVDFLVDIWEQEGLYDWPVEDWGSAVWLDPWNNFSSCFCRKRKIGMWCILYIKIVTLLVMREFSLSKPWDNCITLCLIDCPGCLWYLKRQFLKNSTLWWQHAAWMDASLQLTFAALFRELAYLSGLLHIYCHNLVQFLSSLLVSHL